MLLREQEEETSSRVVQKESKGVVQFGGLRYNKRQSPNQQSEKDRIHCVTSKNCSTGKDQDQIVVSKRWSIMISLAMFDRDERHTNHVLVDEIESRV